MRALWILFALAFLAAAFYGSRRSLSDLRPSDVMNALREIPPTRLLAGLGFALLHYVVLGGYDATSARTVGVDVPVRRSMLASAVGHAFSHALGFGAVTGSGARVRLYDRWGIGPRRVTRIVLANATTYTVGVCVLGAVLFLAEPFEIPPEIAWLPSTVKPVGAVCALLSTAYVALVCARRRPLKVAGYELPFPRREQLPAQLAVPLLAWPLNAAIAWTLLPSDAALGYFAFLEIFLIAQIVGLISHVPGGIGVVESIVLAALSGSVPAAPVVAAFVGYRLAYNVLPFIAALGVIAVHEVRRRQERLKPSTESNRA